MRKAIAHQLFCGLIGIVTQPETYVNISVPCIVTQARMQDLAYGPGYRGPSCYCRTLEASHSNVLSKTDPIGVHQAVFSPIEKDR